MVRSETNDGVEWTGMRVRGRKIGCNEVGKKGTGLKR